MLSRTGGRPRLQLKRFALEAGLSIRTLQRDIAAGNLIAFRIARRVLVSRAEIAHYLENRRANRAADEGCRRDEQPAMQEDSKKRCHL